jgi:hypothetical protein
MRPFYLSYDEARALFEQIVGRELSLIAARFIVRRHKITTKKFGPGVGIVETEWRRYCLARTKGNVLTRPKRTYKKRGPKKKPRKKPGKYVKKRARERLKPGRKVDPDSRRSLRKKRETARKLREAAERRKALAEWFD